MKRIQISQTDLNVSRFIFGTGSLFNAGSSSARQNLLLRAADNGFTHFDTAPYYGFGAAERDLSVVLRKNPELTVTTKVGIYSPGGESQSDAAIFARKAAGRLISSISKPEIDFSVQRAKRALEGSLRRLGRDIIDIYMLHEPQINMLAADEWKRWLDDAKASGKVRYYGLALSADKLKPFLETQSPLTEVVQTTDSLEAKEADILSAHGRQFQITYAYVSAARSSSIHSSVPDILSKAMLRNPDGAIIVSTIRQERLPQYKHIAEGIK